MSLNWKRVNKIEDLKIGDIIRLNLDCLYCDYAFYNKSTSIKIANITIKGTKDYCISIFFDHIITYDDKQIKEYEIEDYTRITFNKNLEYSNYNTESWIEKLIIKEKINNNSDIYQDEIDLLIDCIGR